MAIKFCSNFNQLTSYAQKLFSSENEGNATFSYIILNVLQSYEAIALKKLICERIVVSFETVLVEKSVRYFKIRETWFPTQLHSVCSTLKTFRIADGGNTVEEKFNCWQKRLQIFKNNVTCVFKTVNIGTFFTSRLLYINFP